MVELKVMMAIQVYKVSRFVGRKICWVDALWLRTRSQRTGEGPLPPTPPPSSLTCDIERSLFVPRPALLSLPVAFAYSLRLSFDLHCSTYTCLFKIKGSVGEQRGT